MFSERELKDLIISVIMIAIIFVYPHISLTNILIALLTVGLGFIFHELMHREVARKFGAISEFRAWYEGLIIGLILKMILGATFIAPGAVYIYKDYLTVEESGKIALAGPLANILLAILFFLLTLTHGNYLLNIIGFFGFHVNLFLAGFNLLPIPPFDGEKVIRWNPLIWAIFGIPLLAYVFLRLF
ncbi:peptidase M50 [Methanocaldococcus infernus ME]|uniref:Peptidase M50 n=1 Tax=Methanocaldococcus infernus (strain DSM 11812 / JCM 15783 / ME) TaxID=573063 RepID=D5VQS3_METIM|nr:zinc protease [Methanocaldococcus infernus]ADG12926.1 peptidase M50 [Methanocaldococcus infernus ME]